MSLTQFDWSIPAKAASEDEVRKRVELVRAVLGKACDKATAEGSVRVVIVKQARWVSVHPNKQKKEAVDRVERALHRLDAALNNAAFPSGLRRQFPREQLTRLRAACQRLGNARLTARRNVGDKRIAVQEAVALLLTLDLPLRRSRNSAFCRLAAALHGGKDGRPFYDLCRAYLKARSKRQITPERAPGRE